MSLVIIDYNRTLFDPDTDGLMEGAWELLTRLRQRGVLIVLVSKKEDGRKEKLPALGIADKFDEIIFCEQKTESLFQTIISKYGQKENFVIGDHIHNEIRIGNLVGMTTIQFQQGKFADLAPEQKEDTPVHVIHFLPSALRYII